MPAPAPPPTAPAPVSIFSEAPSPAPASEPATALPEAPPAQVPTTAATKRGYPHAELAKIRSQKSTAPRGAGITDAQIEASLKKAVDFLINEFSGTRLRNRDDTDDETFAGRNALCAYALLHAGLATDDSRLQPSTELMRGILDHVKDYPMT